MREDIRYFVPYDEHLPFAIELVGTSYCDGTYRIERKKSNVVVMEYVLSGRGTIQVDGQSFTACKGAVYILPQHAKHLYYADAKDPWIKMFFNIYGDLPMQLLTAYHLQNERVIKDCPLQNQFERFHQVAWSPKSIQEIFKECALIYHELLIAINQFVQTSNKLPTEAIQLKEFLDLHIHENMTINQLAAVINRSPDYTIKLFKKSYGDTPYAYLLKMKMQVAQNLLCQTSMPVKSVAEQIGFYDAHYFSNMFKKVYGVAPHRYRKDR